MYRQNKPYRKVYSYPHHGRYGKSRYRCKECDISCTSSQQLDQHLKGIKHHVRTFSIPPEEDKDGTFLLENMVVIDETDEDLSNDDAASPASCDSSDSEAAIPSSGFKTLDNISRKHMVILDEKNYDSDHPASPASCDSSGSAIASSSTATVKTSDEQPKKKARMETPDYTQTAPISPSSDVSNCSSSNTAAEPENANEESGEPIGTKHSEKIGHRKQTEPVKRNQDVFKFLKNFEVTNESDVTFAIKMAKMLSRALNKYKEEKLEEMVCTEAEHETTGELCTSPHTASPSSPSIHESLGISSSNQKHSAISQATANSELITSCDNSSRKLSPAQCMSHQSSSTDCQPCSAIIKQTSSSSHYPNIESNTSRSPTHVSEVINSPNKTSATNSTVDDQHAHSEGVLVERENRLTAEAACSDDDDV